MYREWRENRRDGARALELARRLHRARMDKPALEVLGTVPEDDLAVGDRLLLSTLLVGNCELRRAAWMALPVLGLLALATLGILALTVPGRKRGRP